MQTERLGSIQQVRGVAEPAKSSIFLARQRLGWEPFRELFARSVVPLAEGANASATGTCALPPSAWSCGCRRPR
ncbi:transposase domain-containing protein [Streptomyces mirabilis]